MKILFFIDKQFDTATDTATWLEIANFLEQNHEVYLFCRYKYKQLQFDRLKHKIQYFKRSKTPYWNRLRSYYDQLRTYENIIHDHNPDAVVFYTRNILLLKLAVKNRINKQPLLVLDIRSLDVSSNPVRRWIGNTLIKKTVEYASRNFDGITYITKELERYCKNKYRLTQHRSSIWTSGVDVDLFKPMPTSSNNGQLKILYHGSVAKNRGIQNVVRAIHQIRDLNVVFKIIGQGEGIPEIKELINELKLHDQIKVLAPVQYKEVSACINQSDVGILPFPNWFGWAVSSPIKLFEYLSCERPVIATKIPAHENVLEKNKFVFWAESSSPEDLATAIKVAFENKNDLKQMGEEARQFIKDHFTWEAQAVKLESFILERSREQVPEKAS